MLADMATAVEGSRSLYLTAARRKDRGLNYSTQAAMAKLFATDMCMRVTTDAVRSSAAPDTSRISRQRDTSREARFFRSLRHKPGSAACDRYNVTAER